MTRRWLIFIYLIFFQITIDAQFIEKLSFENGLSSSNVTDILQDDNGFLWIATAEGLNRYEGTEVVKYFHDDKKNSIPHNYIYCLKKLPHNLLAIGTQSGLSFYNGNTGLFHNFYYKNSNSSDTYNNIIEHLETDAFGNLWAVSQKSIFIFSDNLKLIKVIASPYTKLNSASERQYFAGKLLPLSNGDVLVCMQFEWFIYSAKTGSLCNFRNSEYKRLEFLNNISPPHVGKHFMSSHVFKVYGKYFFVIDSEKDRLELFDENGREISSIFSPYNQYPYVLWSQKADAVDSEKICLLFHNYGRATVALKWANGKPFLQSISKFQDEIFKFTDAATDNQGNLWLATYSDGLKKISPSKQYFNSGKLINDQTKLQSIYETLSCYRNKNKIWVATYGDGFFEIDTATGKQVQHRFKNTSNDAWSNYVWNFHSISVDSLWIGTQNGIFWYKISSQKYGRLPPYQGKPSALDSVPISVLFEDSKGLFWMGLGIGTGLCSFDFKLKQFKYFPAKTNNGYPFRYPLAIAEDKKGNLWFTSDASPELVYYSRIASQFKIVSLPSSANLDALYMQNDSTLWIGTATDGLIKFIPSKNSFEIYGHDKGLINSRVNSIYQDSKKRLWLVTGGGISCFDIQTGTFTNFTSNEGLPVSMPTAFFYYDSLNKYLYTGGSGAYLYFNPDEVKTNHPPRKTIITALYMNGLPYNFCGSKKINLNADQNDITIQYTAIDFISGQETKYAYKIKEEDTSWIDAGKQRQINLSRLEPGNYAFMVHSGNNSGEWSREIAIIRFHINIPFTQTAWFYGLVILSIALIIYALYRFRLKQIMRTELVRSEISKNLHDEIGSNLTNISLSSLLAQKQLKDETAVSKLLERIYHDSQAVSESMREIVWSINPKIDTLGDSLPRMLHYASQLSEVINMELHAEVSPQAEHVKLNMQQRRELYLIFKEAVNNIVKHSSATKASIHFQFMNGILEMEISDDGKGFDINAPLLNNGIKNMKERAQAQHWQLNVESKSGVGTKVSVKLKTT